MILTNFRTFSSVTLNMSLLNPVYLLHVYKHSFIVWLTLNCAPTGSYVKPVCRKTYDPRGLLFIKCLLIGMLECWCSTKCFIYTNLPTKYFSTSFWHNALPPVHVNHFWNCRKSTSIHFRLNSKLSMKISKRWTR